MKAIKFLSLILFLSWNGYLQAQSYAQSALEKLEEDRMEATDTALVKVYQKLFVHYIHIDLEVSRLYADSAMTLAEELDDDKWIFAAKNMDAVYYSRSSRYDTAQVLFEPILAYYRKVNDLERVSAMLNNIAICDSRLGDLEGALEKQMESVKIKEEIGVAPAALAASFWNIGNIHYNIFNYNDSNKNYRKAAALYRSVGNEEDAMILEGMIASNYVEMNDSLEQAKEMFKKQVVYFKENKYPNELAGAYNNLAGIHLNKNELDSAKYYYQISLPIAEENGEQAFPGIIYRRLAYINRKQGNPRIALPQAEKALSISQELKLNKKIIEDYKELSSIHRDLGNYKAAFENYRNYDIMQDSILAADKILAMKELETKYETEKKEQEILLLKEKEKRNEVEKWALIGSVIGLVALLLSVFFGLRQKLKRNKIQREKQEQEIKFKDHELDLKKQELTAYALQLAHKNEVLDQIKDKIRDENKKQGANYQKVINHIDLNQADDNNWEQFRQRFVEVHVNFEQNVKDQFPQVTSNELRIMALLKMNLSSKEIANILNISMEGIKKARYRLRKKLGLETNDSLEDLILSL